MIITGKDAENKFRDIMGNKTTEIMNKISQIDDINLRLDIAGYVTNLSFENEKLKEQLQNAIIPKFKVGQDIYRIENGNIVKNFIQNIMVAYYKNNATLTTYLVSESTSVCVLKEQDLFATKEEAEQKLKELKGE